MKKMILNSEIWANAMRDKVFEKCNVDFYCVLLIYSRPAPVP